jgi:hypothetical protein
MFAPDFNHNMKKAIFPLFPVYYIPAGFQPKAKTAIKACHCWFLQPRKPV